MPDARILPAAVADNAAWCDLVCRSAGLPTVLGPDLWSTPRRSPDAYPDAVTLRPGLPASAVLAAVDDSPGASVKDSFADLDLAPHGWSVLFEAQWLTRPGGVGRCRGAAVAGRRPRHARALAGRPRFGGDRPGRPRRPGVRLLLADDDRGPAAVAALSRSGDGVVGVSNVRVLRGEPEPVWSDLGVLARRELGAHRLVGYESGPDLLPAVAYRVRAPRAAAGLGPLTAHGSMSNPVRPSGSSSVTSTPDTCAPPGPDRHHATSAATASSAPSTTASTLPSARLRTQPCTPSRRASRDSDHR